MGDCWDQYPTLGDCWYPSVGYRLWGDLAAQPLHSYFSHYPRVAPSTLIATSPPSGPTLSAQARFSDQFGPQVRLQATFPDNDSPLGLHLPFWLLQHRSGSLSVSTCYDPRRATFVCIRRIASVAALPNHSIATASAPSRKPDFPSTLSSPSNRHLLAIPTTSNDQ